MLLVFFTLSSRFRGSRGSLHLTDTSPPTPPRPIRPCRRLVDHTAYCIPGVSLLGTGLDTGTVESTIKTSLSHLTGEFCSPTNSLRAPYVRVEPRSSPLLLQQGEFLLQQREFLLPQGEFFTDDICPCRALLGTTSRPSVVDSRAPRLR
eukprot:735733-Prorocentrum_minimum.AAC.1